MKKICRLFAAALALSLAVLPAYAQETQRNTSAHAQSVLDAIRQLGNAMILINNNYVDTIDTQKMVDCALTEFVHTLDPHSNYIPAKDVKSANEELDGSFEGVGIEFAIIEDTLTVQNVISGGPAEAVGLNIGDRIIKIDTANVAGVGLTNDDVRNKLRGPKGTTVSVRIRRPGVPETLDFDIKRGRIPLHSIDAAYRTEEGYFYVKLGRFAMNSYLEFLRAVVEHCQEAPTGVILDLRTNGGGYMNVAVSLANLFLEKDQMIVYTEGLHQPVEEEKADGSGFLIGKPLVILVDENTASASEILSGAIQDWDKGIIVGRRTFGKGLVQRQVRLENGAQLRLTIARYHTPSGRVIQTPYKDGERDKYYKKLVDRYENGELFSIDSLHFPDSLKFETLAQHRTIYGGGGIMPDIFVPEDTTALSNYYSALVRKGHLNEFVNIYCDRNRKSLESKCPDFASFNTYYDTIADNVLEELVTYAAEKGLERNDEELNRSKPAIKPRLKALVARTLFGTTEYFRVINAEFDPEFKKAKELLRDWPATLPSILN